jgi:phosphoadenosine phosphosulfate reductase
VAQSLPPVQTPFDCCAENIWRPLDRASRGIGATVIVRGQRNSETLKSPVRSGYIENGVKYVFPIEDWTEAQVLEYLDREGVPLPKHYGYFNSSLDCGHCTGYLSENVGRMRYLRAHHLAVHEEVQKRLGKIMYVAASELQHVADAIKE